MSGRFQMFTSGTIIADRYTITNFLGEGAFGKVYQADSKHHSTVALKMLPIGSSCGNPQAILQEASAMARLEHPNVVKLYEIGLHVDLSGQYGYIAMEYLPGGTVRSLLDGQIRISIEQTLNIIIDVLSALAFAHAQIPKIIHGDIKPENVLLSGDTPPHACISDFGVAQLACEITGMASAAGTLIYMPTEMLWGYAVPASDVFCVGILFYMMLTGVSPFVLPTLDGLTMKERRHAVEKSRLSLPVNPSKFNSTISAELDNIILKSLATDSKDRFVDADEFLQSLQITVNQQLNETFHPLSPYELYAELPSFADDEYRELVMSGSLNRVELETLVAIYNDLEMKIDLNAGGLFSPVTITGRTKSELEKLHNHSFSEWLFSDTTPCVELRLIKEIGKQFWANQYSERAQNVGKIIYITAVAVAKSQYNEMISSLKSEKLLCLCQDLLDMKTLPPRYRRYIFSFWESIN